MNLKKRIVQLIMLGMIIAALAVGDVAIAIAIVLTVLLIGFWLQHRHHVRRSEEKLQAQD